jgi:methyl-accepting chemotaxis protein
LARLVSRFDTGDTGAASRLEVAVAGRHAPGRNSVAKSQARLAASVGSRGSASAAARSWEEF